MVLDPNVTSLYSDYGSFNKLPENNSRHDQVLIVVDGSSSGMAQSSDVYQRQPLLSCTSVKSKDNWNGVESTSEYFEDEGDDKISSISHVHNSEILSSHGNEIKIEIPIPFREEPRFPKEQEKTFLGIKS